MQPNDDTPWILGFVFVLLVAALLALAAASTTADSATDDGTVAPRRVSGYAELRCPVCGDRMAALWKDGHAQYIWCVRPKCPYWTYVDEFPAWLPTFLGRRRLGQD